MLCGDWNVMPEDRDVFSARATQHDALMQPEARQRWRRILNQGWTDALRALHPSEEKLYTFWDYTAGCWQRDLGFRLDHLLCSPEAADRLAAPASTNGRGARRKPATMRRLGWSWRKVSGNCARAAFRGLWIDQCSVTSSRAVRGTRAVVGVITLSDRRGVWAFALGCLAVTAGVLLHLPMFVMGRMNHFRSPACRWAPT